MSAPTVTGPDAARPGLPARLRSATVAGRRLLKDGSRALWTDRTSTDPTDLANLTDLADRPPGADPRPTGSGAGPTAHGSRPTWRSIGVGSAIVVVVAIVSLLRQPGAGALNTVWAEDGEVFLSDAASKSWLDSIFTSYAGYYHLGPRVLAELATLLPPAAAAAALASAAALCTALLAALVYVASGGRLQSRVARVLVAAVVVVAPVATTEVPNSIANLQWPGLYALFWILLWTPKSALGRAVAATVTLLVAASSILAVVFAPLAIARVVWARAEANRAADRTVPSSQAGTAARFPAWARSPAMLLAGLLGAGIALQVVGLLTGSSQRGLAPDPVLAVSGFLVRAVPAALVGERWLPDTVNAGWLTLAAVAWLVVAAVVFSGWRRRDGRPDWALAGVAFVHAAAIYAVPVLLSGFATPRYALPAAMLLVTALVAVLEPTAAGIGTAPPLWIFAAALTVVFAVNLRVDNPRAHGPRWNDGLHAAQQECADPATTTARITIAPVNSAGWATVLPCSYVRR